MPTEYLHKRSVLSFSFANTVLTSVYVRRSTATDGLRRSTPLPLCTADVRAVREHVLSSYNSSEDVLPVTPARAARRRRTTARFRGRMRELRAAQRVGAHERHASDGAVVARNANIDGSLVRVERA